MALALLPGSGKATAKKYLISKISSIYLYVSLDPPNAALAKFQLPKVSPVGLQFHNTVSYQQSHFSSSHTVFLSANRLLALNPAPHQYNTYTPTVQTIVKNASRLTPHAIPSFKNIGREKRIADAARVLRAKSFMANSDAE